MINDTTLNQYPSYVLNHLQEKRSSRKRSSRDALLDSWDVVVILPVIRMLPSISPISMVKGGSSTMVTFEQSLMKSLWIYERMNCDMFEWQKSPQCLELREQGGWRRVRRWSKEADGMGLGLIEPLREGKNLYLILASMPLIMWPL